MPGMLPVINEDASRRRCAPGSASRPRSTCSSVFDRKNYFYPDLPQGYQISQYKQPIVGEGEVDGRSADGGESVTVGIERLHLEQDAGKSLHDQHPTMTYVDLNRSGVALMEIVSKPDMRSAEEAKAYRHQAALDPALSRHLRRRHGEGHPARRRQRLGAQAGRRRSARAARSRTSTRSASSAQAIEYEARRQIEIIEDGGTIEQETRLFDPGKGETRSMRSKEEAHDYRYFPDPDLLPLEFDAGLRRRPRRRTCRNCRTPRRRASSRDYRPLGLRRRRAGGRARRPRNYFEAVAKGRDAKAAANWVINELFGRLNKEGSDIAASPVSAAQLGGMLDLIADGTISGKIAKDLFEIAVERGRRSARDRRGARHEAGHRHRRDRDGGRRDHRQESRQGRARPRPSRRRSAGSSAR